MARRSFRVAMVAIVTLVTLAASAVGAGLAVPSSSATGGTPVPALDNGDLTPATDPVAAQQGGGNGSGTCSFPVTTTDTTGTEVTLDDEPRRIVALQPSDAQTLFAIGAREKVVGAPLNQYTAYLNDTNGVQNVANEDGTINTERVVSLNPDLVIAANVTDPATIEQLRQAGITVYAGGFPESIAGVYANTEQYGRLSGECAGANETVSVMRNRVEAIRQAVNGTDRPRVLFYFYEYTAGAGTFTADVLGAAGTDNVAADANVTGYKPVNAEIVARSDPQWILYPTGATIPNGQPWSETTAIERNQTLELNANYIQQPGPRLVIPLTRIARALHPEAMNGTTLPPVDFSGSPTEAVGARNRTTTNAGTGTGTGTEAGTGTETGTNAPMAADGGNATMNGSTGAAGGASTATASAGNTNATAAETSSANGPGFGPVAALIAVLGAALLARFRE